MPPASGVRPIPFLRLAARGLTRRCPRCGARHLFSRWFRLVDRCPGCDYPFAREEGFFLGAFVINFVVTEAALGIVMAVFIGLEAGGGTPLGPIIAAAVLVTVVVPLVFYPFSKTLWAAVDLAMHPDLQVRGERAGVRPDGLSGGLPGGLPRG